MKKVIEKWRDGTDMVCSICEQPIFTNQPRYATITQSPKKRNASHYTCRGGTVTVIGSPEPGIAEVTQYGSKRS